MTLFVILGEGEMPAKEISHQLNDLWKQCEEADTNFWFAMEGKTEATDTDRNIVSFISKHEIHYGLFNVEGVSPSDDFVDVAEYFDVDSLSEGVISLMESVKGEGEESVLLALFTDDDDRDEPLIDIIAMVLKSGFKVFGLNDAMEPVELLTEEVKPMPEDTIEAKPKKIDPVPEVEDDDEPEPISREYLESLTAAEVKEIAKGMGLTPGTKADTVTAILVSAGVEESQGSEPLESVKDTSGPVESVAHTPVSDDPVLVVIHTQKGMSVKWTTMSKVEQL